MFPIFWLQHSFLFNPDCASRILLTPVPQPTAICSSLFPLLKCLKEMKLRLTSTWNFTGLFSSKKSAEWIMEKKTTWIQQIDDIPPSFSSTFLDFNFNISLKSQSALGALSYQSWELSTSHDKSYYEAGAKPWARIYLLLMLNLSVYLTLRICF